MTTISLTTRPKARQVSLAHLRTQLELLPGLVPLPLPEVHFVAVSAQEMADINWQFLKHEGPTDVITFQHGEIVVCPQVARDLARELRIPPAEELLRYCVHGWLHLAGYDDKKPAHRATMHRMQESLLAVLLSR